MVKKNVDAPKKQYQDISRNLSKEEQEKRNSERKRATMNPYETDMIAYENSMKDFSSNYGMSNYLRNHMLNPMEYSQMHENPYLGYSQYYSSYGNQTHPQQQIPPANTGMHSKEFSSYKMNQHQNLNQCESYRDSDENSNFLQEKRGVLLKKAGKKKIPLKYITNKPKRCVSFSKRKKGVMKKGYELNILTGCDVLILLANEMHNVYSFATPRFKKLLENNKEAIVKCLSNEAVSSPSDENTAAVETNNLETDN